MLNPQPEPPIPAFDSGLMKNEEIRSFSWPVVKNMPTNLPSVKSEIKYVEGGAEVTIPKRLSSPTEQTQILIKPEFKIEQERILLRSGGIEVALKHAPSAVHEKLSAVFERNNLKMTEKLMLDVENGKPVYSVKTEQPAKLFGFIPIKLRSTIKIDDEGVASQTDLPWYAKLSKKAIDATIALNTLPNLVLTQVRFEPSEFVDDQFVGAYLTVENQGLGHASDFPDFINGGCSAEKLYYNDQKSNPLWYCQVISIKPGESQEFYFPIDKILCPAKARFVYADNDEMLKETTKEDNSITVDLPCK